MARIRSVHPGLFTDEAFVSLSEAAQILLIGIWTECDDQGAFEWKPITLRMRLRPTKDGSIEPLLGELAAANTVRRYEHEGREYGAVRNFRKYQKPKKPNKVHFMPPEFRTYVGLTGDSSEQEADEGGGDPEFFDQMEDGGGEEDGEEKNLVDRHNQTAVREWNDMAAACGLKPVQHLTDKRKRKLPLRLKELGGVDGWRIMLGKVRASPYLLGKVKDWVVTFDWVLEPGNLTKIMEGNYDDRGGARGNGIAGAMHDLGERIREGRGDPEHDGRGQFQNPPATR